MSHFVNRRDAVVTEAIEGFLSTSRPGALARLDGFPEVKVDRGLIFDTAQMAVLYAMSGEGLALVDPLLFQDEIAAGVVGTNLLGRCCSPATKVCLA